MGRLLIIVALIAIVAWMVMSRTRKPSKRAPKPDSRADTARDAGSTDEPTRMLACAHCGVHLPQSDALTDADGRPFCTEAHRLAGPR